MQRIYLPNTHFWDVLEISEKEPYHQITRVMRARVWQEFIFFDGESLEDHVYKISDINKYICSFEKKEVLVKKSESWCKLSLYQACPNKLSKFETIVQKCCEVGYSKIVFFESERSQKLVLSDNKKERLRKISIEAIEQCWGNIIPEIEFLQPHFSPWEKIEWGQKWESNFICHTQDIDSRNLSEIEVQNNNKINILVWPEGWFSPEEIKNISAQKLYFWERILRCETVWEVVWFYLSQKK